MGKETWQQLAGENLKEAQKAFDQILVNTGKTVQAFENSAEALQGNAHDLHVIALGYAQDQVRSALTLAQELMQARDVSDIVKLQTAFFQEQLKNVNLQAHELSRLATKAMEDITRPL